MGIFVEVICDPAEMDAGFVGDRLTSHHGARLTYTSRDDLGDVRKTTGDLLLLLGSERSVCDPSQARTVEAESELVARSIAAGVPVIGICYGAQLLARALGGQVSPARRAEVGWFGIDSYDPALCPAVEWTQFHEDAFSPPNGARVLGSSSTGCQAFSQEIGGTRVLGWQFHPEARADQIERWVTTGRRILDKAGANAELMALDAPSRERTLRQAAHDLTDAAVSYLLSPASAESQTNASSPFVDLVPRLQNQGVVGVALQFIDTAGVARTKSVPVRRLLQAADHGVGIPAAIEYFTPNDLIAAAPGIDSSLRDIKLVPDLSRVVVLQAQPGWALAPSDLVEPDGSPHFSCARDLLRQQVVRFEQREISTLVAFEVEWMISIGDGDELNPPANHAAYGMSSLIAVSDYGRDLVSALDVQGVAVEQFHPEFSAGQFEVSVSANDPLSAADTTALVRATIRAVGHQHGYRTSFAPKPDLDSLGNGGHLHLSLWRGSENLMIPHEGDLAPDAEAFAAGVLGRLQALAALGAPSPASYLRLTPKSWAGAYGCWGWENREAAIRMLSGRGSQNGCAANLEIKCFDQMANPYLLLAGVLAAGMHGIDNSLRLPEETRGDPATLSSEQRSAAGIVELPSNLDEATKAFANDEMLSSAFGPKLVDQIVMVRRHDADALRSRSAAEVAAATRWVG